MKDESLRTLTAKPFSNTSSSFLCLLVNSSSSFAISKATSFFFFLSPFGTECFNDWILAAKQHLNKNLFKIKSLHFTSKLNYKVTIINLDRCFDTDTINQGGQNRKKI